VLVLGLAAPLAAAPNRVAFTSPNTMVWRDVHFGGTITYQRAAQ
jgi:hypothetical protein